MPFNDFPRMSPGQWPAAGDLNRVIGEVRRNANVTGEGPIVIYDGPAGRAIGFRPPDFWAVVCEVQGTGYTVKEVDQIPEGKFKVMPNGRRGVGYEANGNNVPFGAVVRCYPGAEPGEFRFLNCCLRVRNPVDCTEPGSSAAGGSGGSSATSAGSSATSATSSVSSATSSCGSGSPATCQPFVTAAYCVGDQLVNEFKYMTSINGVLWIFDTSGCQPCSSMSASSSFSLSSGGGE